MGRYQKLLRALSALLLAGGLALIYAHVLGVTGQKSAVLTLPASAWQQNNWAAFLAGVAAVALALPAAYGSWTSAERVPPRRRGKKRAEGPDPQLEPRESSDGPVPAKAAPAAEEKSAPASHDEAASSPHEEAAPPPHEEAVPEAQEEPVPPAQGSPAHDEAKGASVSKAHEKPAPDKAKDASVPKAHEKPAHDEAKDAAVPKGRENAVPAKAASSPARPSDAPRQVKPLAPAGHTTRSVRTTAARAGPRPQLTITQLDLAAARTARRPYTLEPPPWKDGERPQLTITQLDLRQSEAPGGGGRKEGDGDDA